MRGLAEAIRLIVALDPPLFEIIFLSLRVSGSALLFSTVIGIPLGAAMGLDRFAGRRPVIALLCTGMGFPPAVVGLFVCLMLSHSGLLGQLNSSLVPALFTPAAMVVAQTMISFPLVAGFTMAAVRGVNPGLRQQVQALGATCGQTTVAILADARIGVIVSVVAGFGSIVSKWGAVTMGGGNIERATRELVTHNLYQANRMARRVALMLEGHIIEVAGVEAFFGAPQDPRTAAFVRGEMVY